MKKFSIPFSPYLSFNEYKDFYLPFVLKNKEFINDIYTTIRIEPFSSDAMGGNFNFEDLIYKSLQVQKDTQISVSATFNNDRINPTLENLDLFIKNFTPLYESGIHSVTMPIFHWMITKKIQKQFPKLQIKNTIISEVNNAKSFWDMAEVGYDVVNIDRNLLRDFETLKEIKKAQNIFFKKHNKYVKTQILANEQCMGHCPTRAEHYNINFHNGHYFGNEISTLTCRNWEKTDPHYDYRRAVVSPFLEDIEELFTYVDILKMFGRDGKTMLKHSFYFMESYINKEKIVASFPNAIKIKEKNLDKFDSWRKVIKTCKFQCFDCDICNNMEILI